MGGEGPIYYCTFCNFIKIIITTKLTLWVIWILTLYVYLWNNLLYRNNTTYKFLFQHWSWATVGENLTVRLRKLVFSRMLQQEISWFDLQENKVGVLTSRLAVDATIVKGVRRVHDEDCFLLLSYH